MSKIHPSAIVAPGAQIGADVEIGPYCTVGEHVRVGDGCRLLSHVNLDGRTTLGPGCQVYPFASIGTLTQDLKYAGGATYVEIGARTTLREYVTVNSGTLEGEVTRVGDGCLIMAYCHVAHACQIGNGVIMSNNSQLAGHIVVEDQVVVGGMSGFHQFVRIGRMSMVGGMSKIAKDVPPYMLVEGNPTQVYGINAIGLTRRNVSAEAQQHLKAAHAALYRQQLSTRQALEKIRAEIPQVPEVAYLVKFVESSERGIIK
jgi:UDP-N-acetylglucosamine acyltransferase